MSVSNKMNVKTDGGPYEANHPEITRFSPDAIHLGLDHGQAVHPEAFSTEAAPAPDRQSGLARLVASRSPGDIPEVASAAPTPSEATAGASARAHLSG